MNMCGRRWTATLLCLLDLWLDENLLMREIKEIMITTKVLISGGVALTIALQVQFGAFNIEMWKRRLAVALIQILLLLSFHLLSFINVCFSLTLDFHVLKPICWTFVFSYKAALIPAMRRRGNVIVSNVGIVPWYWWHERCQQIYRESTRRAGTATRIEGSAHGPLIVDGDNGRVTALGGRRLSAEGPQPLSHLLHSRWYMKQT